MYLQLTADKRFLDHSGGPQVLLGRWCVVGYEPERPADSLTILPYVFADRSKLPQTYAYVNGVYEHLLPQIAAALNKIHGTAYSDRFWKISAGYWLRVYLEVLYERYQTIIHAAQDHGNLKVKIVDAASGLTPEDGGDFVARCYTDLYNQQLYSQIIKYLGCFEASPVKLHTGDWATVSARRAAPLLRRVKDVVKWISLILSKWNRVYFCATSFPAGLLLRLVIRFRSFPTLDTPQFQIAGGNEDMTKQRQEFSALDGRDEFEKLVCATLAKNFPKIYVEKFEALGRVVRRYFPRRARIIVTANAFAVNEGFKLWTAFQTECNAARFFIIQHGGAYGCALWLSEEDYEIDISDAYFSYGWEDATRPKVIPFIASSGLGGLGDHQMNQPAGDVSGPILWVLASYPRYSYTMYSVPSGPMFSEYLDAQAKFIKCLSGQVREVLRCKAYTYDYGWQDLKRIRSEGADFAIDTHKTPMSKRLRAFRLIVVTYNGTAHLESLVQNVPTVVFWNPDYYEIREDARPFMDRLHRAGILHYSAEAAAGHVNAIADDTLAWWRQPEVQQARREFCERFARTDGDAAKMWIEAFGKY